MNTTVSLLVVIYWPPFPADEGVINETEEEHREVIARLGKLREYVEMLDYKDKELEKFCRERFSIIADIMQVYEYTDVLHNVSCSTQSKLRYYNLTVSQYMLTSIVSHLYHTQFSVM